MSEYLCISVYEYDYESCVERTNAVKYVAFQIQANVFVAKNVRISISNVAWSKNEFLQ